MIPSVLAGQVRQGVEDFLRTTFPIATPRFHGLLDRLFEGDGITKGPYLSIQLPFSPGRSTEEFFPEVPLGFRPYLHQERAFERLSSGGARTDGDAASLRSTIVATGTGSGKTESFLFPILDHCRRHRGESGIKALLIYPMNALASDQAGRLAKAIWANPELKGHVTAGLFVGQRDSEPHLQMGPDHLITDRDMMRTEPPDILLTNYKMLDYLLIRPRDFVLWKHNGPETLRYLVVDELHTFDGAQGSDLACLIRRLKARLGTPEGHLCCVGTSATLGGENAEDALRAYAEEVFGEAFDAESIITESRRSAGGFLEGSLITQTQVVPTSQRDALRPDRYDRYEDYVRAQVRLWFGVEVPAEAFGEPEWRVDLGERLRGHTFFRNLLTVLGGRVLAYDDVLFELRQATAELREAAPGIGASYRQDLLSSLIALVSAAREWRDAERPERGARPFLEVRVQVWLRELRRMVGSVDRVPELRFADDLPEGELERHLPVVHCRDCNSTGWAGLKREDDHRFDADLRRFYVAFFGDSPNVAFVFPEDEPDQHRGMDGQTYELCGSCLSLSRIGADACGSCRSEELVRVFVPDTRRRRGQRMVSEHDCPYCGSREGLTIMGSRAASLTSVLIAQLFSSSFNDDKKLITFSDSVQDASHRAGFFGARTYRFNLRAALQQFVAAEGEGMALDELPEAFVAYWTGTNAGPKRMSGEAYVATFLAPDMAWFEDYELLKKYGRVPRGSTLLRDVDRRVEWEILSEYGFRSRIGRTLEKTGSSVAYVDPERLNAAVEALLEPIRNEIGEMRALEAGALRRLLLGFVARLKGEGAIHHPELSAYVNDFGNAFLLNRKPYLPGFGRQSRAPVFLTSRPGTRFDTLLSPPSSGRSWSEAWAVKTLSEVNALIDGSVGRLYELVLEQLVESGVLREVHVRGDSVWGLRPDALRVTTGVEQLRCGACGHNVSVAASDGEDWENTPCLRYRCGGRYVEEPRLGDPESGNSESASSGVGSSAADPALDDYYGKLYATGDIERIFAEEHTGLLKRSVREELEAAFTRGERRPWDPNLLSCTPTLEMGIDIGDLSSVVLCSVPPAQANYLQRIGRAGRRDGNALGLTVANGKPHDLFFFAEPKEMIAGHVETPRVYLNASSVLERQFTAFCFDRWVESGVSASAIPDKIGKVLDGLAPYDETRFPHNFLRFIELHQGELLDTFVAMFEGALTAEAEAQLRAFVEGHDIEVGSLRYKITSALHDLKAEQDSLRKKVRSLRDRARRKEDDPAKGQHHEEELAALKQEWEALNRMIRKIRETLTYNFFTDEGLLPNYAFPEAGVTLRSIIYRKKRKSPTGQERSGGGKYTHQVYEYERPAARAIHELAPGSRFYAEGRSVEVDQINVELSEPEAWRFCDRCAYLERTAGQEEKASCPRCGSEGWSDVGQERRMARMRQVFATTSDRESRVGDDKDDREPAFFVKAVLVDFEDRDVADAYRIDDDELPFGFEFIPGVTFREVNFGRERAAAGQSVVVAGREVPREGFAVCRHCGKVEPERDEDHALWCIARGKDDADPAERLYLYREFASEAVRILLPTGTFAGSEEKLHSFIAALQLGLKERFGRVDHLRTAIQEEPVPGAPYRKQYLVLYDTVPGGTGYLGQLMRETEPMMDVFERALSVLTSCSCNRDPDKDGCYRCLYAYRNSYDMPSTSRTAAARLLTDVLEHRERLVQVPNLRGVSINAVVESELEAMFIEALRRLRDEPPGAGGAAAGAPNGARTGGSLRKDTVNGKPGWYLRLGERAYYVEPQVSLGPEDGVGVPSRADFVLWPARDSGDDGAIGRSTRGAKPVAVFTDGFRYHRDRVGQDLAQRMAIAQSGRFRVWSLTYRDVQNRLKPEGPYFEDFAAAARGSLKKWLGVLDGKLGGLSLLEVHRKDSFAWLLRYLRDPDDDAWRALAAATALALLDPQRYGTPEGASSWEARVGEELPERVADRIITGEPSLYGLHEAQPEGEAYGNAEGDVETRRQGAVGGVRLYFRAAKAALSAADVDDIHVAAWFQDAGGDAEYEGFERAWAGYLRLHNLFQFLPRTYFVTAAGAASHLYDDFVWVGATASDAVGPAVAGGVASNGAPANDEGANDEAWREARELTEPDVHGLLDALAEAGWPVPEVGFDLVGESGAVVAEAELAWPSRMRALIHRDRMEGLEGFERQGWEASPLAAAVSAPAGFVAAPSS